MAVSFVGCSLKDKNLLCACKEERVCDKRKKEEVKSKRERIVKILFKGIGPSYWHRGDGRIVFPGETVIFRESELPKTLFDRLLKKEKKNEK